MATDRQITFTPPSYPYLAVKVQHDSGVTVAYIELVGDEYSLLRAATPEAQAEFAMQFGNEIAARLNSQPIGWMQL